MKFGACLKSAIYDRANDRSNDRKLDRSAGWCVRLIARTRKERETKNKASHHEANSLVIYARMMQDVI